MSPSTVGANHEEIVRALQRLDGLLADALTAFDTNQGGEVRDRFRGLYVSQADARGLLNAKRRRTRPHAAEPGALWIASDGTLAQRLARMFGLGPFELDALLIAFAPEFDLRYERLYAYLQDDVTRKRPTVDLVLSLLVADEGERLARRGAFASDGVLLGNAVARLVPDPNQVHPPLLAHYLAPDEQITRFLLGDGGLDTRLAGCCRLVQPRTAWADLAVAPGTKRRLTALARAAASTPACLWLHGPDGAGKGAAAEAVARESGATLLVLDASRIDVNDLESRLRIAMRESWFRQGTLQVARAESWLCEPRGAALIANAVHTRACRMILTSTQPLPAEMLGVALPMELPVPEVAQRTTCWRKALAARGSKLDAARLSVLAGRFRLTPAQIASAVADALLRSDGRADAADFLAAARAQSGHALADVATRIEPRASWDDIVLPADAFAQLRELCDRVDRRERVLGDWGFARKLSRGRGTAALFTGGSGTGKTMAAEVVAGALGLDLYRIDLARMVSKYIGETEKNLDRVFAAAEGANAILLFDEADALFGKRSEVKDAHDRYANIEVSYLLQKMEDYEGIAILATNLADNLDDAFTRRLAFHLYFPFPDEAARLQIWQRAWPEQVPLADTLDRRALARDLKLAGGSIKNIALGAAFAAAGNGGVVESRTFSTRCAASTRRRDALRNWRPDSARHEFTSRKTGTNGPAEGQGAAAAAARAGTPVAARGAASRGNQAFAQGVPATPRFRVSDEIRKQMKGDIEAIVAYLRKQILWESDERRILTIVRRWADEDKKVPPGTGSPYLDQFLTETKMRTYTRKTARSGAPIAVLFGPAAPAVWDYFPDQWSSVYNDLFLELEDDRLTEFQSLVGHSQQYSGAPPEKELPENFWKTMGKKEAVGVWGIMKGMGTSIAGMSDAGAWAITRSMQAAGIDVADPPSAREWLAKQYDFVGDEVLGKEEWSEGEELFLGMNAAEFSTAGGELVWQLVMMGKGGGGAKWVQIVEKALGTAGSLQAVEASAKSIAAMIEQMQKDKGHIDVAELAGNPDFAAEVVRLVANVFGAVAGSSQQAKRIAALLEGAQLAPMIGKLIEIATSNGTSGEKAKQLGPVLMDILKQIVSTAGAAHSARGGPAPGMEGAGGGKLPKRAPAEDKAGPAKKAEEKQPAPTKKADEKKPAPAKKAEDRAPAPKPAKDAKAPASKKKAASPTTSEKAKAERKAKPPKKKAVAAEKPATPKQAKEAARPDEKGALSRKTATGPGDPPGKTGAPPPGKPARDDQLQARMRREARRELAPRKAPETPDDVKSGAREPRYKAPKNGSNTVGKPVELLEQARKLYDDVIAETSGKHEVGIWQKEDGTFVVRLGQATEVDAPRDWRPVQHFHTNAPDIPLWRMPARADVAETSARAAGTGRTVTEMVEYPLPGGKRGRAAYTVRPDNSVTIEFVDASGKKVPKSFKSVEDYNKYYDSHKVQVEPGSEQYKSMMKDADQRFGKTPAPESPDTATMTMAGPAKAPKSDAQAPKKKQAAASKPSSEAPVPQPKPQQTAPAEPEKAKKTAAKKPAKSAKPAKSDQPAAPEKEAKKKAQSVKAKAAAPAKVGKPSAADKAAAKASRAEARKYLDDLRQKKPVPGSFGESWDHKRFPKGPGRPWRPGDPPDMPSAKGHPTWDTIRERVWKNLAHNELAARKAGQATRDTSDLLGLEPVKSLTDNQLRKMLASGRGPKGFEIEHARIPQRAARMFERAGLPADEARRLAHLGDPSNLEPAPRAWHAVVDEVAAKWKGRNPTLPESIDDRAEHPLGSMRDLEVRDLLDAIAKHKIDLSKTPAGLALRDALVRENARRGNKWVIP